ncbi:MAG TPA: hypothetical protein VNA28_10895 [Solirubrobacteraceae bacterium]|nr:hypothetical protein [Solirubrobacteraceae bacterium]
MHGNIDSGEAREARRRQTALQRTRELLGPQLMAHCLIDPRLLLSQLEDQRLTLGQQHAPLSCRLFAIPGGAATVLRGQLPVLGGLLAPSRGAPSLACGPDNDVAFVQPLPAVFVIGGGVELCDRKIARISGDVS